MQITPIIPCTTRPRRSNEVDGFDYNFVSSDELKHAEQNGGVIEKRVYRTVKGEWCYFTKLFSLGDTDKISMIITTPAAICKLAEIFGKENLIVIYLDASGYTRLDRCIRRERMEDEPNYREVCRRYLSDEEDFAPIENEDFHISSSCYRIDANKSISDCKKQFMKIYKTITNRHRPIRGYTNSVRRVDLTGDYCVN
jgi:guanylate kinase